MAEKQRNFIDALPICQIELVGPKPKAQDSPKQLNTFGDHIRARRLDLGMPQTDVARLVGASKAMVAHWEKQHNQPSIRFLPKI